MEDFILRADKPLGDGDNWYVLNIFHNEIQQKIQIYPTPDSIKSRHLEWPIPGLSYNKTLAKTYYPSYSILSMDAEPPAKKAPVKEIPVKKESAEKKTNPQSPFAIRQLKLDVMRELKALGVSYPNGCNYKKLQDILAEAKAAKE